MMHGLRSITFITSLFVAATAFAEEFDRISDITRIVGSAGMPPQPPCGVSVDRIPAIPGASVARKADVPDWAAAGFKNPVIKRIDIADLYASLPARTFTRQFSLTSVVFRNTGWTTAEVESRLKETARIYSQCGLKITEMTIVESDAPQGKLDIEGAVRNQRQGYSHDVAKATPVASRPTLYYVRSTAEDDSAYAQPRVYAGDANPLTGTVWMSSSVLSPEYKMQRGSLFNPEAHEIGHVLGNWDQESGEGFGHRTGNGLNVMGRHGDQFDPDQCEDFRNSEWVKPLR